MKIVDEKMTKLTSIQNNINGNKAMIHKIQERMAGQSPSIQNKADEQIEKLKDSNSFLLEEYDDIVVTL